MADGAQAHCSNVVGIPACLQAELDPKKGDVGIAHFSVSNTATYGWV